MRSARLVTAFVIALIGLAAPPTAPAQAPPVPAAEGAGLPSIAELRLSLKPMRRDALQELAEAWLRQLEPLVAAVSEAELAALQAPEADRDAANAAVEPLRDRRQAVIERIRVVLAELRAKGGDVQELEQYVAAVTDTSAQPTSADAREPAADRAARTPISTLRLRMSPLRRAELKVEAERWLGYLEDKLKELSEVELERRATTDEAALAAVDERVKTLRDQRTALIDRIKVVIGELRARGGAVEEYDSYLSAVSVLEIDREPGDAADQAAQETKSEADLAIDVDPDVLRVRVAPLRRDELVTEVEKWMSLLQSKVRELSEMKIAHRLAPDDETRSAMQPQIDQLAAERGALEARVKVVIGALRDKGGEVAEYQKYVDEVRNLDFDTSNVVAFAQSVWAWTLREDGGIRWGTRILLFLATIVATWIIARLVARIVRQAVRRLNKASALLRDFLVMIVRQAILVVGFVFALAQLGVNIGPLLAALGAVGFILGFALQGTLSNFASGVMILAYRPFDIGDVVDVAGVSGKVESMTLVSTTIATFDNQTIVVPNNSIWGNVIKNVTGRSTRRVDLQFGVSYADDVDKAVRVLHDVVSEHKLVLKNPEPTIKVNSLGDSSVNIICRPWSKTADYWTVYWDLMHQVKTRFDREGISIPFPQRDVHVYTHGAPAAELPA